MLIRWGGEEFLLLSRYTDRKDAHTLAKRVLNSVGSSPYQVGADQTDLTITCSIGWAVFPWKETEPKLVTHEEIHVLADYALYQAKGSGRNRAVGLLPEGETVRGENAGATIFINGIPASPIITLGPRLEEISAPSQIPTPIPSRTASASTTS